MRRLFLALCAVVLAGCGAMGAVSDSDGSSRLIAQYATIKVIDGDFGKRDRVIEVATEVKRFASSEDSLTVDALMVAIRSQVDFGKLDAADTLLINGLLTRLQDELAAHLGVGALPSDVRLAATTVADWVIEAAGLVG